jgi:hypothetical protein
MVFFIILQAKNLRGDYDGRGVLGFNTITMVPHQRKCIDEQLLDQFEVMTFDLTILLSPALYVPIWGPMKGFCEGCLSVLVLYPLVAF